MIITILIFLIVLSVLVVVHEFGHFYAARKSGMDVEEFGLGFPPRVFSWKDKKGMLWSLNAIPLGGFVKIKGESGDHKNDLGSFANKSIFARFVVLIAGVVMNFLLAIVILTIGFMIGMPQVLQEDLPKGAIITDRIVMVADVLPESPAGKAEIALGDKILTVNGVRMEDTDSIKDVLSAASTSDMIELQIEHAGESSLVTLEPTYLEEIDGTGIGVALVESATVRYPFYLAPIKGIETTVFWTVQIPVGLYDLLKTWVAGEEIEGGVAGPVGIAKLTGEVARDGFGNLLRFTAFLSVNLAILNVMPFPALDGGRIAFLFVEAIRRKPNSPQVEAVIHNLGFLILMLLVIVVTYSDIVGLLAS